jgi:hypothetical protein
MESPSKSGNAVCMEGIGIHKQFWGNIIGSRNRGAIERISITKQGRLKVRRASSNRRTIEDSRINKQVWG